jgi:hypothetical protein
MINYGIYVYDAFTPLGVVLRARRFGWSIGPENWVVVGVAAAGAPVPSLRSPGISSSTPSTR